MSVLDNHFYMIDGLVGFSSLESDSSQFNWSIYRISWSGSNNSGITGYVHKNMCCDRPPAPSQFAFCTATIRWVVVSQSLR